MECRDGLCTCYSLARWKSWNKNCTSLERIGKRDEYVQKIIVLAINIILDTVFGSSDITQAKAYLVCWGTKGAYVIQAKRWTELEIRSEREEGQCQINSLVLKMFYWQDKKDASCMSLKHAGIQLTFSWLRAGQDFLSENSIPCLLLWVVMESRTEK